MNEGEDAKETIIEMKNACQSTRCAFVLSFCSPFGQNARKGNGLLDSHVIQASPVQSSDKLFLFRKGVRHSLPQNGIEPGPSTLFMLTQVRLANQSKVTWTRRGGSGDHQVSKTPERRKGKKKGLNEEKLEALVMQVMVESMLYLLI